MRQFGWYRRSFISCPISRRMWDGILFFRERREVVCTFFQSDGAVVLSRISIETHNNYNETENMKMKKLIAVLLVIAMLALGMTACSTGDNGNDAGDGSKKEYKIGICNYVDDASLNQIVENIRKRLEEIGNEKNCTFKIFYDNCNGDSAVMSQIIAGFIADNVDLMVAVATPVAVTMQSATEDNRIPVVFAAVSDPLSVNLVNSLEVPGGNITGTSDYLNTNAVMNLITAADPDVSKVGLLYDLGQDSSTAAIADAKAYLDERNISYVEHTGTTVGEVMQAAEALVADGVEAVFTPTDNTIMKAELSIYETFAKAGIPHYAGADSFALNGAFLGYGVDYIKLGRQTADMIAEIVVDGKSPAEVPVKTFDNGTATINTEICAQLGLDFDTVSGLFAPFCTKINSITTAEYFE